MSAPYRFGPFFLESRLAVGGTAEVYLARPAVPGGGLPERLVVKRLLPHFANDPEGRTMFHREATLHAAVNHPNAVTVFGAGEDDKGEPYLAMEFIDGVDGYRLLRRLRQEDELLPVGVSVYLAREILRALESVHAARDPNGGALGIIHRDVSPSNVYLSKDGGVKLGDFGIAKSTTRPTLRSEQGHVLKGKFAYLAPEQVAGETSDHRADLFSLATVLAEMLLNRPLFPGTGQLAILLAIRDCKIDALSEIRGRLPPGLFEVMRRALARDPAKRYPNASDLLMALSPFQTDEHLAISEVAARVRWAQTVASTDQLAAVRESGQMRALRPTPSGAMKPVRVPELERKTSEYELAPSNVLKANGELLGPWTFARLMEALATGQVTRGDTVDFVGRGFQPVEEIEEFTRFFPSASASTTGVINGPGKPDFADEIDKNAMLRALVKVYRERETGVLFAERADEDGHATRKELYFVAGKLHHVASSNTSELLGEYLVRRGKLAREELDLALAVLPRYGGRIGDTLISMGLVGSIEIFRAIREQGRDRVADLFLWRGGKVTFYRGQDAPVVEFPLDIELPSLMLAGLEAATPGDAILDDYRRHLDRTIGLAPAPIDNVPREMTFPEPVERVLLMVGQPAMLREILKTAVRQNMTAGDALRALEILIATEVLAWKK